MTAMNRRGFLKRSCATGVGMLASVPIVTKDIIKNSPNDRVNIAIIGVSGKRKHIRIQGRGRMHYINYSKIPNVRVATVCDVDERLFPAAVNEVEELFGEKPKTETDFRKVLEDKDIDVVSITTPDHWHALQTIWACQAGKDIYAEKPVSHNLSEGRKMVQAARKYNRVVQSGLTPRSRKAVQEGIQFVKDGKLGDIYMARGIVFSHRASIGHVKNSPIPKGVNWDRFLGPAQYRPFNENRFIYNWHWFWDTGTTEFGNNGVYQMDVARWAMNKRVHPLKIHCTGGFFGQDSDQEAPNTLVATYEYSDGTLIQCEIRSLFSNKEDEESGGCFLYGSRGWMHIYFDGYKTFFGRKNEPGPSFKVDRSQIWQNTAHWENFIDCVRSGKWQDLNADILEGHMSTAIGHLGVISYRTGRKLTFNSNSEKFFNDNDADSYLTRQYRPQYS
ncbi:Gfo/Idh/MocA family protein, partial [candidate division KSB1 bacterium]